VAGSRCIRRHFPEKSVGVAAGAGVTASYGDDDGSRITSEPASVTLRSAHTTQRDQVALVRARSYGVDQEILQRGA
jgi:hypothetical protein